VSRVESVSIDLERPVSWLTATVGELMDRDQGAMSPQLPPGPGSATAVVSTPALGVPGQELERPDVAGADRASRGDAGIERSDWERAWVIILTCIGIGVAATARCRGLGRRDPRRGGRPRPAPLGLHRAPRGVRSRGPSRGSRSPGFGASCDPARW
jgi:hypothetical protein